MLIAALVAALVIAAGTLARRHRWAWAMRLTTGWDRLRPWVQAYVRCSPATFTYLFVLFVTSWVLRSSTITLDKQLLWEHGTNLDRLKADPVSVLVTSAFWVTGPELLLWAVLFPLVLAPAEKWLGTRRAIVAFAIGHVGATLVTAVTITYFVRHGWAPRRLRDVIDVGSSYGFCCVAALFAYRLPNPWRWIWAATLVGGAVAFIAWRTSFSDYGHLVAILIGLALHPLIGAPTVKIHGNWPIWRPPSTMVDLERERIEARRRLEHGGGG